VLTREPASPRLLNPAGPRDLETIVLKCLEKEPARRYSSAGEVTEELDRFLKDEPIRARPTGTAGKAWR
jgi:serine/threonine-protein kinase